MDKKRRATVLMILVIAILLFVILIGTAIKLLKGNSSDDSEFVIDQTIGPHIEVTEEDKAIINKYNSYHSNENAYMAKLSVEERKGIIKYIDEVINALNKKEYATLYSKMTDIYKGYKFETENSLKEYLEEKTNGVNDYTCLYYKATYYGFECAFVSESNNENRIDIQIIPNEGYSDYNITMNTEAIVTIKEKSNVFLLDGIRAEILYELSCANSLEFSIELKNTTQKTLECNFENSSVESTRRGRAVEYELVSPKENVILLSGQKKRVSFIFNISDTEDPRPNTLNMRAVINGKKVEFSVYIENDEYDF